MIYTDSCFFFDSSIAKKLKKFYDVHKPLTCEIDAYGDFLPALGSNSTGEYIHDTSNVVAVESELRNMRRRVYRLLNATDITLIILNRSRFYHVGTLYELIHNFCIGADLIDNMGFRRFVNSVATCRNTGELEGVIMQSMISHSSTVPYNSVIGYCKFNTSVVAGEYNILSNCSIGRNGHNQDTPIVLPDNIMFHTIPVLIDDKEGFVTVAFGINDDVKKALPLENVSSLKYYGTSFSNVLDATGYPKNKVFDSRNCSLWTAKLFGVRSSMEESFESTFNFVQKIIKGRPTIRYDNERLYSMANILYYKDAKRLVQYRLHLKRCIQGKVSSMD